MSKILFITYENPFSRNSGDSIYTCNILEALTKLPYQLHMIYYDSNDKEPLVDNLNLKHFEKTEIVNFRKKNPLQFIFSANPGMIENRISIKFSSKVNKMLRDETYTYIIINHMKMLFTLPDILKDRKDAKLVYISHNVEYLLSKNLSIYNKSIFKKLIYWQDAIKTWRYENKWIRHFDAVSAISEHDALYFKNAYKVKRIKVLRPVINMVNIHGFHQKKKFNKLIIGGSFEWDPKKENLLMFLNSSNFHKLYEAGIELIIAGKAHPNFVKKINNRYKGVYMTGAIPSLTPYYQKAGIAIIPERLGGGFKLKVIEAALSKTAIIAIKGAITPCNFQEGLHFIEKNSFEELISEILRIQRNPKELDQMIGAAYKVADEEYTLDKLTDSLYQLINFSI